MTEGAPLPSPTLIEGLLGRLDAFVQTAGTVEIHDVLYGMLQSPSEDLIRALSVTLTAHPDHPLHREISTELSPWLVAHPLTLEDILRQDAPLVEGVSPLQEVRRRLLRARDARAILAARIERLEKQNHLLNTTANGMAAVAAFLAVFAIMGWLAALNVWIIPWLEPIEILPPQSPESAVDEATEQ